MDKQEVELKFYSVLRGSFNLIEFEKWIYDVDDDIIDKHFGSGFYFELASLNYRDKYVINKLEKLLFTKIPFGRFEKMKIKDILESIILDKDNFVELIEELYDLYCDGYSFLEYLGLSYVYYGMPRENETYSFSEQSRLNLKSEAQRILSFLNNGKIVITGEYEYVDNRTEEEKNQSNGSKKIYLERKKGILQRIINWVCRTYR
jgi:hypothetical protein